MTAILKGSIAMQEFHSLYLDNKESVFSFCTQEIPASLLCAATPTLYAKLLGIKLPASVDNSALNITTLCVLQTDRHMTICVC